MIALFIGCSFNQIIGQNSDEVERNKQIAVKYHKLDPNDIDDILSDDFIGHWNDNSWNREDHRQNWSNNQATDKIVHMIADKDMVAVKFIRSGKIEGKPYNVDVMHFMQIKNGKIVEIWELFNQDQLAALNE